MFKWAVGNINEANRKKRLEAVNDMTAAIGIGHRYCR